MRLLIGLGARIPFLLLVVITAILAVATGIEKLYGREAVLAHVYNSTWMVVIWAMLFVASFVYIFRRKLYAQKPAFFLHLSLGLILVGAFVSYTTSERGYIHLRQGKPVASYTAEDEVTKHPLPFEIKLVLFEIEYHPGTEKAADYISFVQIDGEMQMVSMNKIIVRQNYRLCQLSYDSDEMGSILLVSRDPWGIMITYAGYLLLGLSMLWLLWLRISRKMLAATAIASVALWFYISQMNPMTPVLRTPMLALHVSVIIVSYLLLLAIALISLAGIISKKRRRGLYLTNIRLLYPALFLLAAGIFIGAVWANISWGRYWGWDAKETWALITMFVYALPMHRRSMQFFANPLHIHRYCAISFLSVLMTFLGVSLLLGGLHSYI